MEIAIVDCNHGFFEPEQEEAAKFKCKLSIKGCKEDTPEAEIIEKCKSAIIIIVQRCKITGKMIDQLPNCKVVVRYGVGVDNLEVEEIKARGVCVLNFPRFCTQEVANHAMSLILYAYRRLYLFVASPFPDRSWGNPSPIESVKASSLTTIGILGLGRIGSAVSKIALACGFNVIAHDIDERAFLDSGVQSVGFDELMSHSDILTLHCPLTDQTSKIINAKTLSLMKKDAAIVNTARGGVVDPLDVLNALGSGNLRFACLDVFDPEPAPDSARMDKMWMITPHIAFYSQQSLERLKRSVVRDSVRLLHENS